MRVLADTSVWVDHFRRKDAQLVEFLEHGDVVIHPFVIGELLLGHVKLTDMLDDLNSLPRAAIASHEEVVEFIQRRKLSGLGIGYVDAHLLASTTLSMEISIWTRDRRLRAAAQSLNLAADLS